MEQGINWVMALMLVCGVSAIGIVAMSPAACVRMAARLDAWGRALVYYGRCRDEYIEALRQEGRL